MNLLLILDFQMKFVEIFNVFPLTKFRFIYFEMLAPLSVQEFGKISIIVYCKT